MNTTYMQSGEMLGTTVELRLVTSSLEHAEKLFVSLWNTVRNFESRFSRFLPDSELSKVNCNAGNKTKVSHECIGLLTTAKKLSLKTGSAFNPFVLPQLQRQGYQTSMTQSLPKTTLDFSTRRVADISELEVGEDYIRIPEDSALDLGGIGKGYLADKLAEGLLVEKDLAGFCLSFGGDINVSGCDDGGKPWSIDIQSAKNRESDIATWVADPGTRGIATSGMVREKGKSKQIHQVLPSESQSKEQPYALCTVTATTATIADVLASSILVKGQSFALQMLKDCLVKGVLLQPVNGDPVVLGTGIELHN